MAEILERLQQAPQVGIKLTRIENFKARANLAPDIKKQRASARPEASPTPSNVIPNRGAAEQSRCANHSMTHTGPYDAISDT